MIRRPPRSTHCISSAASDVYKRQVKRNYGYCYAKYNPQNFHIHSLKKLCTCCSPGKYAYDNRKSNSGINISSLQINHCTGSSSNPNHKITGSGTHFKRYTHN
eukprot:TRINITY_DN23401_c0_g1_i1.p3 TRINITY_DN23401_c0_g1~~TRINITY_DN23401_c0_g1_i1.p3  ORF type:complete len:103 (+),score=11.61 TRINITY_DN23401_c0_g1_i1:135-443(+)